MQAALLNRLRTQLPLFFASKGVEPGTYRGDVLLLEKEHHVGLKFVWESVAARWRLDSEWIECEVPTQDLRWRCHLSQLAAIQAPAETRRAA